MTAVGAWMAPPPRDTRRVGPLYSQGTYWGRVWQMMHVSGPGSWVTLFASARRVEEAQALLAAPGAASPTEVWRAKKTVQNAMHPDSGQAILLPFRMSAHVPVNTALLVGMLSSPHNPRVQMFWQWCNQVRTAAMAPRLLPVTWPSRLPRFPAPSRAQTFNACQFFANKNASNPVSGAQLACSYVGAVAASLSTVVLCDRVLRRWERGQRGGARGIGLARAFIPFVAAAASKPLQLAAMRVDELRHGVVVRRRPRGAQGDAHDNEGTEGVLDSRAAAGGRGTVGGGGSSEGEAVGALRPQPGGEEVAVGRSRVAGAAAVGSTVATRVLYLAPPMLAPPLVLAWMRRRAWLGGRPRLVAACHVLFVASMSALATPLCMALFSQEMGLRASALEARFAPLGDEPLYFNKGL